MANEDKRDDLFSINLGEDTIEIDTESQESGGKDKTKPLTKTEENVLLHDDGSFEVDEFSSHETDEPSDDEDDDKFIEKDEKKGKAPSKGGSSDSSPSSSPYLAFAKDRASEGVFLDFSDEDWKELVERNEGDEAQALRELHSLSLQAVVTDQVEKYKQSLTPEERLLYEAKDKGLPVDKYSIAKRNHTKYAAITADQVKENQKLQEELVSKALEFKGFTPEEIQEEIEGYKALENLESKALKAMEIVPKVFEKEVKDIEAKAIADDESRKDGLRKRVAKMKSLITNTPEIIPGIKLNKAVKDKIEESMTVPVAKDREGNPLNAVMATRAKNPEAFEIMIHYYHQLGLFNIDDEGNLKPDFSKISKIEKTKAVDSLRGAFEARPNAAAGKPKKMQTTDDELDDFDKAFARVGR